MAYANPARQRAYQAEWIAERRRKWLAEHGPCVRCKTWKDLEVDHIDPAQKISHHVWSWSQARREAELAKCQVLCHDCHTLKTEQNGENPFKANGLRHGTRSSYQKRKCRCDECRAWNTRQRQLERQRHATTRLLGETGITSG